VSGCGRRGRRTTRPSIIRDIRLNRAFLNRTTDYLARAGVGQFLDIGMGIPASPNVHEVAQAARPDARVVYADNDPLVLAYARELLTSRPEGAIAVIDADLRSPGAITEAAAATLRWDEPVAIILVGVLHLIRNEEDPYGIVARLMAAAAAGSYLVVTHPASDIDAGAAAEGARRYNSSVATAQTRRSFAEVSRLFDGLEVLEPGVVQHHRWRPQAGEDGGAFEVASWSAVGRKP
jgi:S-adenosyl methyltransferase